MDLKNVNRKSRCDNSGRLLLGTLLGVCLAFSPGLISANQCQLLGDSPQFTPVKIDRQNFETWGFASSPTFIEKPFPNLIGMQVQIRVGPEYKDSALPIEGTVIRQFPTHLEIVDSRGFSKSVPARGLGEFTILARPHNGEPMEFTFMKATFEEGLAFLPGQSTHFGNEILVKVPEGNVSGYIIQATPGQCVFVDQQGAFHSLRLEKHQFSGAYVRTPIRPKLSEPLRISLARWELREFRARLERMNQVAPGPEGALFFKDEIQKINRDILSREEILKRYEAHKATSKVEREMNPV